MYMTYWCSYNTQPYDGIPFMVPLVHTDNTRSRHLKGHNMKANNVKTIMLPRKMKILEPTTMKVKQTIQDRVHPNSTTGEVTIQSDLINNVIYLEIMNTRSTDN